MRINLSLKFGWLCFLLLTQTGMATETPSANSGISSSQEDKANLPWTLEPWPNDLEVLFPARGVREHVAKQRNLPDGAVLFLKADAKKVQLVHVSGAKFELQASTITYLDESILRRQSNILRTAMDILPSNLLQPFDGKANSVENLVNFFVPRVPLEENIPPRVAGPNGSTQQPIRPVFPGPVHFIETTTLPVQIGLEWPVGRGQIEPHAVYLWSENRFVHSPSAFARGGKTKLTINDYGRYYWQIEDASLKFLSVPRTIVVVRPGEKITDEPIEEQNETSSKEDEKGKAEIKGGMALALPVHRSTFVVCGISKKQPMSVPLRVDLLPGAFKEIEVEVFPRFESTPIRKSIGPTATVFEDKLTMNGSGSFEIRAHLIRANSMEKIPLNRTQVQIEDLCPDSITNEQSELVEKYVETIEEIPKQGKLDFLRLSEDKGQ